MHYAWPISIMASLVVTVAIESYFLKVIIFLEYNIMKHKIIIEDRKVREKEPQIKFSGQPFVILRSNFLDCTHGVNHLLSKKENVNKKTTEGKVTEIYC